MTETFDYDDLNWLTRIDTTISGITLSKTVGYDNRVDVKAVAVRINRCSGELSDLLFVPRSLRQ
ncbi:MAG: hypothetical protein ACR2KU_04295 [Gammaproteobacteria bacterium]|nr:hypothetical protein [Gammaproteobacteria bacterium]